MSSMHSQNEDEADVALYDARKAELAFEPGNLLPSELSMLILRGNSRLKAIRLWRGMKQSDLAKASGIGQGSLSDLESGRRPGSKATLARLAKGLSVDVNWLA
jgi:DNA-binding XRE family transcriptional regulator